MLSSFPQLKLITFFNLTCGPKSGEYYTDTSIKKTIDLYPLSRKIQKDDPLLRYFLDGSRRVYKIDDIEVNKRVFPIIAGQIVVACCERKNPDNFHCVELENNLVLSLPTEANPETRNPDCFYNNLRDKINKSERLIKTRLQISKVLSYYSKLPSDASGGDDASNKYENRGIIAIQDEMIDGEKKIVSSLTSKNLLSENKYLLKDGSLQYKPVKTGEYKEMSKIKNNYRWVIGVSKQFNPEFSKDRSGKSNAVALANLPLYHRTPAYMFQHDRDKWSYFGDSCYSVWYIRIRDKSATESPFAGIVKVEKILITESELNYGLESDLIDVISANIINERNPVCYGKDSRWANHLYPVFLTEQFLKSKYLSDLHFINLF